MVRGLIRTSWLFFAVNFGANRIANATEAREPDMMDARKEARNPTTFRVLISDLGKFTETVSTENVSSSGLRVHAEKPCRPGTTMFVKSLDGQTWASSRIVYCQEVKAKTFALGLELPSGGGEWLYGSGPECHRTPATITPLDAAAS